VLGEGGRRERRQRANPNALESEIDGGNAMTSQEGIQERTSPGLPGAGEVQTGDTGRRKGNSSRGEGSFPHKKE